jgi:hypothetical protein
MPAVQLLCTLPLPGAYFKIAIAIEIECSGKADPDNDSDYDTDFCIDIRCNYYYICV